MAKNTISSPCPPLFLSSPAFDFLINGIASGGGGQGEVACRSSLRLTNTNYGSSRVTSECIHRAPCFMERLERLRDLARNARNPTYAVRDRGCCPVRLPPCPPTSCQPSLRLFLTSEGRLNRHSGFRVGCMDNSMDDFIAKELPV